MNQEPVDLKEALDRVQEDRGLLMELFDIFQDDFVEKRKNLEGAIRTKDFEQIKSIAHSLKGASGNISAKLIHAACLEIEQKGKSQDLNSMDGLIKNLDSHFFALQAFIKKLKEEQKT
jgi:HPt (histidine-containing phosphotransfer) domain-containing protein